MAVDSGACWSGRAFASMFAGEYRWPIFSGGLAALGACRTVTLDAADLREPPRTPIVERGCSDRAHTPHRATPALRTARTTRAPIESCAAKLSSARKSI